MAFQAEADGDQEQHEEVRSDMKYRSYARQMTSTQRLEFFSLCSAWQAKKPLSQAALNQLLRRICCPKEASGKLEVSEDIYRQYRAGGDQRKMLMQTLVKCDGDKDCKTHTIHPLERCRTPSRSKWSTLRSALAGIRWSWRTGGTAKSR